MRRKQGWRRLPKGQYNTFYYRKTKKGLKLVNVVRDKKGRIVKNVYL